MLDLFLSDKYKSEWPKIQTLAESDKEADFELLKKYTLEGYRLATAAFGLLRKAENDATVKDGDKTVHVKKGEQVFVNFVSPITHLSQPTQLISHRYQPVSTPPPSPIPRKSNSTAPTHPTSITATAHTPVSAAPSS